MPSLPHSLPALRLLLPLKSLSEGEKVGERERETLKKAE
jgi:hypothetical protein